METRSAWPRGRPIEGLCLQVLCVRNLSRHASVAQLVALFSRFQREEQPPVIYRLLTGRMKGQAFITLPGQSPFPQLRTGLEPSLTGVSLPPTDVETAQNALRLVHGYRGLGKPLVVEFGRERQQEEKQVNN